MSWLVLPENGAFLHCSLAGIAVAPVSSPSRIFCTYIMVTGDPAVAVAAVGNTAMMPSGFNSPTVCCATTGSCVPVVLVSVDVIDLMSFAPTSVLLVFQIGNLL